MGKTFEDNLRLLDFEESSISGLLFTHSDYREDCNVSFDEVLVLQRAKELGATAVYFRRIEGRPSIPQVFIYDNSDRLLSKDNLVDVHKKIWSSGLVPLYYVFDRFEVKIFNGRKPLKQSAKELELDEFDTIELASLVHEKYKIQKYSAFQFRNGSFWELNDNKGKFSADSSASKQIIEGLRKIRAEFRKGQNEVACNKLLVLSILVKYLEEREDSKGRRVLEKRHFKQFDNSETFCDILRCGKAVYFFEYLGQNVNGKIFELDEHEKYEINRLDQKRLADFLDANKQGRQLLFWRLYDFNYVPVELISRIYEEFIPERKDIAYTPPHLADFMIDECMPLCTPREKFKVIDVSCGSGIFLVSAFKRLVQWWQIRKFKETGELRTPTMRTLKAILQDCVYGLDIEGEAVKLAIFSLTIALCEILDPTKMWDELTHEKLPNLGGNIFKKDFFDFLQANQRFDLVIGNPPFNNPKQNGREKEEYWAEVTEKADVTVNIPDKNFALLFMHQAARLLKENGLLSFVMPSGPLLYNAKSMNFMRAVLNSYEIPQIFDFSRLKLFEKKNYPVCVAFIKNCSSKKKDILHVVVQRTMASNEKLYFEIDKYDLFYVSKETARNTELIWKVNHLGGELMFRLIDRLCGQDKRNLGRYLRDKEKNNKWQVAEGYKVEGDSTKEPEKAAWLTNKRWIPTNRFVRDTIDDNDIDIEHATSFERTCKTKKRIFKAPHLLIKETPALPVAFRCDDLIFRNEIIGVHAPDDTAERNELLTLRKNIIQNRKLYHAILLSMSGRAGISRSAKTVLKKDIMRLPYPEKSADLKLSEVEQIVCDDVYEYYIDQLERGEDAKINSIEANRYDLFLFGKTFCDSLNSIYQEGSNAFYGLVPIPSHSYICYPYAFGDPEVPVAISERIIKKIAAGNFKCLVNETEYKTIQCKRVIKLYSGDGKVFLIKPKKLRYWLRSVALRDASDVFADLVGSGY